MSAATTVPFAAVLLAGGQSRRMGRDKALLPLPDGRKLWQRQLDVLQALRPAELFISGSPRPGFPATVRCLPDKVTGRGPLGGIAASLETMTSPRLLVLAIDLPAMTTIFLHRLLTLETNQPTVNVVPQHPKTGFYEPLAAIYSKAATAHATRLLTGTDWSLQNFVRTLPALCSHKITQTEEPLFTNWNHPSDFAVHRDQ